MIQIVQAVIPAAGLGTRLRPLTYAIPKELLPVGRLPVLAHVVEELRAAGITRAAFIVSQAKPQIRAYFGDLYPAEPDGAATLECGYIVQPELRGLGHAIGMAREWCSGEPFVVAFGDCIIESNEAQSPLQRLLAEYVRSQADAATLLEEVAPERVSQYGIVKPLAGSFGDSFELEDIIEKPLPPEAPSRLAVAARWALAPAIFDYLDAAQQDSRGEINLTDAVRRLKHNGGKLWGVRLLSDERRRDIGNFGSFFEAFVSAALRDDQFGSILRKAAEDELRQTF